MLTEPCLFTPHSTPLSTRLLWNHATAIDESILSIRYPHGVESIWYARSSCSTKVSALRKKLQNTKIVILCSWKRTKRKYIESHTTTRLCEDEMLTVCVQTRSCDRCMHSCTKHTCFITMYTFWVVGWDIHRTAGAWWRTWEKSLSTRINPFKSNFSSLTKPNVYIWDEIDFGQIWRTHKLDFCLLDGSCRVWELPYLWS